MALRVFKHARAALEAVRGTNLAPTRGIPFTEGTHDQKVETIYPEEYRNSYFIHYIGDAGTETNAIEMSGNLAFAHASWLGNVAIKAIASGTGAGADKTWTFIPTGTVDDLKTATIQFGYSDNIGATRPAWELGYCLGDSLELTWDKAPGTPGVTYNVRLVSPEAATQISAFTGVGTYTTENGGAVKAVATAVTIDSSTIGSTADNDVLNVTWRYDLKSVNLYTLNNTTAAQDTLRPNAPEWTATVRRYYRNDTENDAYVAKTLRKIRVRTLGPSLGGGTYKVDLELYGKYTDRAWAEVDGLGVEEYTLGQIFDSGAATDFQMVVVNDQSTIT